MKPLVALVAGTVLVIFGLAQAQDIVTISEFIRINEGFSILSQALEDTGLAETLGGADAYTLIAPTDQAFAEMPAGRRNALLANPSAMRQFLKKLVLQGTLDANALAARGRARALDGSTLRLERGNDGILKIDNLAVVAADQGVITAVKVKNGVIHVIESVQGL